MVGDEDFGLAAKGPDRRVALPQNRPAGYSLSPILGALVGFLERNTRRFPMAWQTVTADRKSDVLRGVDPVRSEVFRVTLAHMVESIERAWVDNNPFPHFIVEGIFPDDIYSEMLASFPKPNLYDAVSYEKHADNGVSNRGKFALTNECIDQLTGRQRSLWFGVRDALGAPKFKQAVFARLGEGLAYRFGTSSAEAAQTPGYPLPELLRETEGYQIKPHPDTRRKLVTMQIALPSDNSQAELGTEFYRRSLNPLALLREPRGFDVVKRSPFLPNVGYAFAVLNTLRLRSWHGRTKLAGQVGVRNTILNIWYAKAEDANGDLVEQYYRAV
jgi:hypothetical protein